MIKRSLRTATWQAIRFTGVLTVFNYIKVEGTQLRYTEIHQRLSQRFQIVVVVKRDDFFLESLCVADHPGIEWQQLICWHHIGRWCEAIDVRQQETAGITYTAIRIGVAFQNFIRNRHLT